MHILLYSSKLVVGLHSAVYCTLGKPLSQSKECAAQSPKSVTRIDCVKAVKDNSAQFSGGLEHFARFIGRPGLE